MGYLALYRKYRPKSFSSVVGQNEIKQILSAAVKNDTISHAYLFSGPRGTGKTTTAKIFAKMVNCENLLDGEPCNKCNSCLHLFDSNDVVEIDAASNNGVDEIRNLREKATLVPSICRYKVYIIDEVHMLTTQAFNALLKILEEPPKHVIFILATTEYYKIPLTILSRCQKFQFNKLTVEEITNKLKDIAKLEKINITDEAIEHIAKISDGGMRDSINFLDQIRSFNSNDVISINDVYNVCGETSVNEILKFSDDLIDFNYDNILTFIENLDKHGKNFQKFLLSMVSFYNDLLLYKKNVSKKFISIDYEKIQKVSEKYTVNQILFIMDGINSIFELLKNVSRQKELIISNLLLLMEHLKQQKLNVEGKTISSSNNEETLAFDFSTSSEEKSESIIKTENNDNLTSKLELLSFANREIIINNAFTLADKKLKLKFTEKFTNISSYLSNKMYSLAVSLLVDTDIQVAANNYLIMTVKYDELVDKIYYNYNKCKQFLNMLFDGNYDISFITLNEWIKYKNEYISNLKSGKKYTLKELKTDCDDIKNSNNDNNKKNDVDKLVDIIGDDCIEFK